MKNEGIRWLAAEPYVQGVVRGNDALLYNTVSRVYLLYRNNPVIAGLARQLLDPGNSCVIGVSEAELNDPEVSRLVDDLRAKYMGDLHDPEWSKSKPFNIFPAPVIKESKKGLEEQLGEITFHLGTSDHPSLRPFRDAYLQFPFPVYARSPVKHLSPDTLRSVAGQISSLPMAIVNFIGTEILDKPSFRELSELFRDTPFKKRFHVPLSQLTTPVEIRPGKNDHICLYVTFPMDERQSVLLQKFSDRYGKQNRVECNFVVRNGHDVNEAMELLARLEFRHTYFKPYLDGKNIKFFRDQVFITEEEIRASRPSRNQVFSRMTMNGNDFGKLTIMPGGDVYANLNDEKVGNLSIRSIKELADTALEAGTSWLRTRTLVTPCRECIFQFLCPPIGNYEIMTKRFNFCHIYPE